ncbi:pheromone-regulated membrane protein [Colletotrichum tofieldiae]|uniref:Pheromone-regulated membrane protein n=1 Tax=Colletotrichum tofieldiae TaxID=708197 RepID=A0A166X586_9PEZI|nr:pheromone-regulated membrane protein [Colletotrichum tofieldiae]GKT57844.1 pheromone-regulated membrane protein [Colletotrichum tofieldiae]GKT77403.1 pheromone-regulated membrane protein [Colletotrichum tofieldiae]GKT86195.1 pheromone-regulated membrane protein [Colletotrichum tofieldiae]
MGCLSHRKKVTEQRAEQKWDYINLNDFKSRGCLTPFAYFYLWLMLIISLAVYGVDMFTAVNLLAFDRWSSEIDPAIDFKISKWIFSISIIASFVNIAFEQFRAMRVMKRGNVAECYLDNIAVRLESVRMGKGQGWKRFLVFAELTKSKKGAEYIALFTYFSFQSWIRVLVCSGPRQVVNALTLKSVYDAKLAVHEASVEGSLLGFFDKIKSLATEDYQQALILSGMLFTLVIWVFSALYLIMAVLFYVFFLFHWIPKADGGLSGYCERKVTKALMKIVTAKVNKALARQEETKRRLELKAAKKNGEKLPLERQATLPTLPNVGDPDKLAEMPMFGRNDTFATLPAYESRPGTPGSIELNSMDQKRPLPSRMGTTASTASYSSRAPLVGGAADFGYQRSASPVPSLPPMDLNNYPPARPGTSNSQRSFRPQLSHVQTNSQSSLRGGFSESPAAYSPDTMPPFPPPVRSPTARTMDGYGLQRQNTYHSDRATPAPRGTYDDYSSQSNGRASPAPSAYSTRSGAPLPRGPGPLNNTPYQAYQPYNPTRSATGPVPPRGPPNAPLRNMTAPVPPRPQEDYFTRPGTSQSQRPSPRGQGYGYNDDVEAQRDQRY